MDINKSIQTLYNVGMHPSMCTLKHTLTIVKTSELCAHIDIDKIDITTGTCRPGLFGEPGPVM